MIGGKYNGKDLFIENDNGEFYSEDHSKRYISLTGHALKLYLESPQGKKKRFYVEDDIGIEVPKDKIKMFRSWERRKQYIAEMQKDYLYYCISLPSDITEDGVSGEEVIADESVNIQETAISNVMSEQLRKAFYSLTMDEQQLIQALFLDKHPISQTAYARKLNMSQQAVSKRISSVLIRLKKILEKNF